MMPIEFEAVYENQYEDVICDECETVISIYLYTPVA